MITIQNIKKGFSGKSVIDDVSAEFDTGKCNLIIGASGSGKTVLMKCLVGLLIPDDGDISYDAKSFSQMNTDEKKEMRRKIGMLCYIENEENIYILSKSGIWEPFNSSSTGTGSSSWNYTQMDPLELNNMFNETLNIGVTDGSI